MVDTTQIREHMEILGSDGVHVGTVDHLDGESQIKLAKSDPASGGRHHYVSIDDVETVDTTAVHLKFSSEDALRLWATP